MASTPRRLLLLLTGPVRDIAPVVVVVAVFQGLVIRQPLPDIGRTLTGVLCVAVGLRLFVFGLQAGVFPLGESMAQAFARKGSLPALLVFAFALGAGSTVAEPTLIAVAAEAASVAAASGAIAGAGGVDGGGLDGGGGGVGGGEAAYALALRLTVAASVGAALVLGVLRILRKWSLSTLLLAGWAITLALTPLAPADVVGIAYDCGGVTTSTVTVPLVTALGVGLASSLKGRNPLTDGFGLIAFASVLPVMFVLAFGIVRAAWGAG